MDNSTGKKQVDYDYWIYITLSDEVDRPISWKDWADVVESEPGMAFTDDENTALAVWNDQGVEYRRDFHYEDGIIASGFVYFDNPVFDPNTTVAGIRKMLTIADRLRAKVIDEEDIAYHANGEMNTGLRWDEIPFRYKRCQIKLSPAIRVDDTSDMLSITVTRQDSTYIGGLLFIVVWTLLSYPFVYFGWIPFPHAWLLVVLCPLIVVCLGLTILLTQFRCELSSAGLRAFYRGIIQRGKGEFQLDEIERFEAVTQQEKRQWPEYRVDVVLKTKTLNMFYQLPSESDMSGIVALTWELSILVRWFGEGTVVGNLVPGLADWLALVKEGLDSNAEHYPFIAYGTDWLAFAHIMIAIAFVGPLRDPVKNIWIIHWAMLCCIGILPLALICGAIRGIPWGWQCIDCSFGVFGIVPLILIDRWTRNLENMPQLPAEDDVLSNSNQG